VFLLDYGLLSGLIVFYDLVGTYQSHGYNDCKTNRRYGNDKNRIKHASDAASTNHPKSFYCVRFFDFYS